MELLWIEIINPKARILLRDLANMDLIRIKKEEKKSVAKLSKLEKLTKLGHDFARLYDLQSFIISTKCYLMLLVHWCKYLTICKLRKNKDTINFVCVLIPNIRYLTTRNNTLIVSNP